MSRYIIRKGWKLATGPPSWSFQHESGWTVRTSEDPKERRPYRLFAPDGNPVNIVPYHLGFVTRCRAMAIAEFFARNPFLFESLQNHAKQVSQRGNDQSVQPKGADPLALRGAGQPGQPTPRG